MMHALPQNSPVKDDFALDAEELLQKPNWGLIEGKGEFTVENMAILLRSA